MSDEIKRRAEDILGIPDLLRGAQRPKVEGDSELYRRMVEEIVRAGGTKSHYHLRVREELRKRDLANPNFSAGIHPAAGGAVGPGVNQPNLQPGKVWEVTTGVPRPGEFMRLNYRRAERPQRYEGADAATPVFADDACTCSHHESRHGEQKCNVKGCECFAGWCVP